MKLSFYGADQCVTGSCHCLEVNGKNILIDCGLAVSASWWIADCSRDGTR